MTPALLLVVLSAAAPAEAAAILKSLEDAGRSLKTMRASFVETKLTLVLDEKTEARGQVLMQIPGRFRYDYKLPQESAMVIKDGQFARYFPKSKQVFRGAAKGEADLLVGFGPGASGLAKKYEVSLVGEENVGPTAVYVLDLKPRQPGLFTAIRLWIDKARSIPVQTRLTEPTGDHTTVRFEAVIMNGPLLSGAFDLKLPRDVVEVR
jgi:outer membrane lipoprotein-sorting protein